MIDILTTPLGPVSLVAILYATIIYISLSRKLGTVTKMRPYYRGFVVSLAFIGLALMAYVIRNSAFLAHTALSDWLLAPAFGLAFFHVPLFIGISVNVVLIWHYWSWLLSEKEQ
ncbi:MAG: hypothetical protein PVI59_17085 [Anaerolineae bacterium]